ncbi:ATPase, T2SS/T4P/T4SS family, partial [Enterococcus faecalis]|uniref:ATPase, T2SS/T4P/T4SS family n=1 Tax=Enterococcus faecalis TaxID=1351 RepID=UPI00403F5EA7
ILSGALPTGERVQVIIPPATRGDVAIAIRKHAIAGMALDDYRTTGAFAQTRATRSTGLATDPVPMPTDIDPIDHLRAAVRSRQNILISGGTSTGKTTFLNALLREVPAHERLILIEDTPELQMTHANAIGLLSSRSALGEAAVSTEDLLIASLP